MENYPDARHFYMNRSWTRRKEFRRRQKKFTIQITNKIEEYIDADLYSEFTENHQINTEEV